MLQCTVVSLRALFADSLSGTYCFLSPFLRTVLNLSPLSIDSPMNQRLEAYNVVFCATLVVLCFAFRMFAAPLSPLLYFSSLPHFFCRFPWRWLAHWARFDWLLHRARFMCNNILHSDLYFSPHFPVLVCTCRTCDACEEAECSQCKALIDARSARGV